ncbi:endoglucanase-like [Littorina saxatilis]|uniref:Cellulase n=1 Tax=Littorina saxatilis TaxID=31220 RepID=A0AAN9BFN5_9CAEN
MLRLALILVCISAPLLKAQQKCKPDARGVRKYNGKSCGSTTRFDDGHRGSCGCGPGGDTPFSWNLNELITAPSSQWWSNGASTTWCAVKCGTCIKLTPTGGYIPGKGRAPSNNSPHIFLVINNCPHNGNEEWCGIYGKPGTNHHNSHGYEMHFDLQNHAGQVNRIGWDNPEVVWEEVNCPSHFHNLYQQCECAKHGK